MRLTLFSAILLGLMCNVANTGTIFRCTEPSTGVVTFSDLPCLNAKSTQVRLIRFNDVSGITEYEQGLIDSFDARTHAKDVAQQKQEKRGENEKVRLEKRCRANQKQIDKVYLTLKHGYKGKKYNVYHDKLRDLKRFRYLNCD